jgi:hypothetical protein
MVLYIYYYMCPKMSWKTILLAIALCAILKSALKRLLSHVNLEMASQVSFTDESLLAILTFEWFVVGLWKNDLDIRDIKKEDHNNIFLFKNVWHLHVFFNGIAKPIGHRMYFFLITESIAMSLKSDIIISLIACACSPFEGTSISRREFRYAI